MAQIDKYEVLEEIGRGGMGAVYKALHPQFKKFVAIKEIRADLANNPHVQRRFEQEIEVLAQVPPHPNIVTVRDALVWEGNLYIVMDYIEGQDLSRLIRSGPIDPDRCARLLDRILSGLEAIHSRGIVHRDLKSGNILIDANGTAFITDFGIAEFTHRQSNAVVMATPRYSAPELIDPRLRGDGTDQQLDVYAAGILTYEMVLGESQFRAAFPAVYNSDKGSEPEKWLRWHLLLNQPARPLNELRADVPAEFARIISRMMAKEVKQRYKAVRDVRRELVAMIRQQELLDRQKEATFDQTIPLERPQSALTNVAGPDTAALYDTYAIQVEEVRAPKGKETVPQGLVDKTMEATILDVGPLGPETVASIPPDLVTRKTEVVETKDVDVGDRQIAPAPIPARSIKLYIAAGVLLLLVAVAGWLFLAPKSVTLIVRGAPADSAVFVDNQSYGVTAADGTLRIPDLAAGVRSIRVSRDGYKDFNTSVEAKGGAEQVVFANLERAASGNTSASPAEIDYQGAMVLIPAGQFIMGDDRQKPDEGPSYRVTLQAFYIDKYEVTNAQYKAFCEATGRPTPTETVFHKEYFEKNPNKPVIGVSWQDAADYAAWAGKRLPTEEEWEKAASWDPAAQKKRQYPWGDEPDDKRANIGKKPDSLSDVGQSPRSVSAYGVEDMAGNAAEWVESFYQPYKGNQTSNPRFGVTYRVIRGGDVRANLDDVRTTRRQNASPDTEERYDAAKGQDINVPIGFRCAISASDPKLQATLNSRR